jgi:rod shape-determining protein MreC
MKTSRLMKRFSPVLFLIILCTFLFAVKFPRESKSISYQFYQILFHPVYLVSKQFSDALTGAWTHYIFLGSVQHENEQLKHRLKQVEGIETQVAGLHKEVLRLRGLLGLKPKSKLHLDASEVIALDMSPERNAFWINSGGRQGIHEAQPVIDHNGVVGQVYRVYPTRSLVLTLRDPLFTVHVVNTRTDERAVLTGQTVGGFLRLRYLHRDADVRSGDLFVTSGLGSVFPQGIGVGTVANVIRPKTGLESEVYIKPLVDIERVQKVFTVSSISEEQK